MDETPGPDGGTAAEDEGPGIPLRQLLLAVGDPLVRVLAAPAGLDVRVDNIVIVDPDDQAEAGPLDLALLIGARGDAARHLVRSAARRGASAVAVKTRASTAPGDHGNGLTPGQQPFPEEAVERLRTVARESGVALLSVRPDVRWEQLQSLCRGVLDDARLPSATDLDAAGDLFSLAQTIATLTGGLVSIEDAASRVLAYSGGEEADELRQLSVLGRQGPEQYLALLRDWGVFSRLRSGEEVVHIDERPELGIRRRLAVGIHAGSQPLGTIWVQETQQPLAAGAEEALLGAARMTALHMLRHRSEMTFGLRLREDLLSGLLEGRIEAAALADTVEVSPQCSALVVAFALPSPAREGNGSPEGAGRDRSGQELNRRRLVDLISVHTAAYRRSALTTALGGRVYALLPEVSGGADGADSSVRALTHKTVRAAQHALGVPVQAAVGSLVEALDDVWRSRHEADRILDAVGRDMRVDVNPATIADVRSRVLVSETLAHLRNVPELRDPRVTALVEYDTATGSQLVRSLVAYFTAFGDVRQAARQLHIHPNTLRYRVRRAESVSGLDLSESNERLFAHLQLLLEFER
ncbi:CdaR family transcriptional regulator [Haloactinospora alba]|uniref:CdaR family transcriptional regulator n=1 Tax=Haloactinospora alba TaxID=405555 RepID=A0A543NM78_9ACTN|nr:PucR family transcriptional regulator [Haloactinospora alba]TQN32923.1 CdaR family transcriptional regulator [Haloactinospora alba]